MAPNLENRIFNLDIAVLRSIAILLVLGYHLFPGKLPWGFVGVDIFFVISGYLIAQILGEDTGWGKISGFYLNRARRIYPALILMLTISMIGGFVFLLDDEFTVLLESIAFSLFHLQNFYEMTRNGYFVDAVNFRPLLHLWSLGVEFQFYILFPILIILGRSLGLSFLAGSIFLAGGALLLGVFLLAADPEDKFFLPITRFWELALGAICFTLMSKGWQIRNTWRSLAFVLSLICWAGVIIVIRSDPSYPGLLALLPTLGAVLFILASPSSHLDKRLLRPILFIGAISYSLYLWHFPIIEFARQSYGSLTVEQRLAILSITFVAASVTDLYLVPRFLKTKNSNFSLRMAALGLLVCFVALLVSMSSLRRPVELRNEDLLNNINFSVDYKFSCAFLTGSNHKDDRCRYEAINGLPVDYAILGDSHANSFTTVFDGLAQVDPSFARYLQIGRGLCPMVPGVGDAGCELMAGDALKYLLQPGSPNKVLLVGQWPLYIGAGITNQETTKFLQGLESLFDTLNSYGKKIIFVHVVPLGALPRTCIRRLSNSNSASCDIPVEKVLAREFGYRAQIDPLLKKFRVMEFDPVSYLCDEERCAVFRESKIFYLDDSHLSRSGGNALALKSREWFVQNLALGKQ